MSKDKYLFFILEILIFSCLFKIPQINFKVRINYLVCIRYCARQKMNGPRQKTHIRIITI